MQVDSVSYHTAVFKKIISISFLVEFLGSSMYSIILSIYQYSLTSSFLISIL